MAHRLNILLIGSGGREHALARRIATSPLTGKFYAAPGNPGIAQVAECVGIAADDVARLTEFAVEHKIDFVIVGPETALVAGIVDSLAAKGITAFGPNQAAAALEGSKSFMKDLSAKYHIPTADYARFCDATKAKAYISAQGAPIVIKADGLAAGKGVTVAMTIAEAEAAVDEALVDGRFGASGNEVVIEEFMTGEEASFFALVDGKTVVPFGAAQDHKAVGDGDVGPNTGGMGAYSPTPVVTPELHRQVLERIVQPLADAMVTEGKPYRGILYAGLMVSQTDAGSMARLIEINVRFGDPECQVLMARLESDPVEVLLATARGKLAELPPLRWSNDSALTVVMCAKGYPGTPKSGTEIRGLDKAEGDGAKILHAGTKSGPKGEFLASGGRVLNIVATGRDIADAQARAYRAVDKIDWPGGFCRRDIGWRAIKRLQA